MSLDSMFADALTVSTWPVWPSWRTDLARGIPGVGRAIALYTGLIGQMPLERFRGIVPLSRPSLLERPDPLRPRTWFIGQHVDDLLMHGNAIHLVTARDAQGWPASVMWIPATRVTMLPRDGDWRRPQYAIDGVVQADADIVHVQRGADPMFPWRGIGVIEQHTRSLGRTYTEEAYEAQSLSSSGVPSVAIIAPNPRISDEEIKQARAQWEELYGGPTRVPGIFPAGTDIKPLAWSPTDAQLTEARGMSLTDVANVFNLDGYWFNAPASSHTYRSPGPQFTVAMRTSLEPIVQVLEQEWSNAWLPRGQSLRFTRRSVEQDTMEVAVGTIATAVTTVGPDGRPLMSIDEGRAALGLAVDTTGVEVSLPSPLPTGGE